MSGEEKHRGPSGDPRGILLAALIDPETIAILNQRLTPEMKADLIEAVINPYFRPDSAAEVRLSHGAAPKTARARRER